MSEVEFAGEVRSREQLLHRAPLGLRRRASEDRGGRYRPSEIQIPENRKQRRNRTVLADSAVPEDRHCSRQLQLLLVVVAVGVGTPGGRVPILDGAQHAEILRRVRSADSGEERVLRRRRSAPELHVGHEVVQGKAEVVQRAEAEARSGAEEAALPRRRRRVSGEPRRREDAEVVLAAPRAGHLQKRRHRQSPLQRQG